MLKSEHIEVDSVTFTDTTIKVSGTTKDKEVMRTFSLSAKDAPHPDLVNERKELGRIIASIIELDTVNQERCVIDKIKFDSKAGTYNITLSLKIQGITPSPKITLKNCNDITRLDGLVLFNEAAKYISGEKTAQLVMEF